MGKSITNTSSINNKNVRNNNTVVTSDIKSGNIICTNLTATNITNAELQTATSEIATLQTTKQDVITAGDGLSFTGSTLNAEVTQSELDAKQDTITAGDGLSFTGSTLNAEVTQTELDAKQNLIVDTTDIELNDLNVNGEILFQRNNSTDSNCTINRSNNAGKMKFVGNTYAFRDSVDSQNLFLINNSGTVTTVSIQADFFSSITSSELDFLDGVSSNVQTQIDSKQATITAGDGLSFTGSTLNAEVTQTELDAKQDTITSSTLISCNQIDCNENKLLGVTSLSCQSIELHNSSSLVSFLDFGGGDFRFRQLYNQAANTFTFTIDDATGANPESKMVITRTEVEIENANLNLNSNDITNGGDGSFSTITLNGNDVEDAIDDKADDFATNSNGLIMDAGAFPIRELRLLFDSVYFNINGSNELSLNKNINECKTTNFNLSSSGNWGSTTSTYPYISGWGSIATPSGSTFLSNASNGIFSVDSNGLYKIVLTVAGENVSVNNRVVLGVYLSIDDVDTSFRATPGEFMLQYLRDDNFGVGGSSEFTVFKTLTTSNTIRFKTRIATGTDNRAYDDQTDDSNLNLYTSFIIEKIS